MSEVSNGAYKTQISRLLRNSSADMKMSESVRNGNLTRGILSVSVWNYSPASDHVT